MAISAPGLALRGDGEFAFDHVDIDSSLDAIGRSWIFGITAQVIGRSHCRFKRTTDCHSGPARSSCVLVSPTSSACLHCFESSATMVADLSLAFWLEPGTFG